MKLRSDLINSKQELLDKIFSDNSGEELDRAIQNTTEAKTSIMMLRIKILKFAEAYYLKKDAIQLKEKNYETSPFETFLKEPLTNGRRSILSYEIT